MELYIGVVSQKGGVGKSTLCRMIACEYARSGWNTLIADMDAKQGTSYNWHSRRIQNELEPEVGVSMFPRVETALKAAKPFDLVVFDGAPHSTQVTLHIAKISTLLILPTGTALDDLEPTIKLANEIIKAGVGKEKVAIALCRIGNSPLENQEAINYINESGFSLLKGELPEKTVYRRASDLGRAATETTHPTTNKRAAELMKSISNRVTQLQKMSEVA